MMLKRPKFTKGGRLPGNPPLTPENGETLDLSRSQAVRGSRQADSERQENKSSGAGPRGFGPDATEAEEALALTEDSWVQGQHHHRTTRDDAFVEALAQLPPALLARYVEDLLSHGMPTEVFDRALDLMYEVGRASGELVRTRRARLSPHKERGSDVRRSDGA